INRRKRLSNSTLEHRQTVVVQLQEDAINRGRVDRAGAPAAGAGPAAVAALRPHDAVEIARAVLAPGQRVLALGAVLGEHLVPAVGADEIDRDAIVEMGVLIEPETLAAGAGERDL